MEHNLEKVWEKEKYYPRISCQPKEWFTYQGEKKYNIYKKIHCNIWPTYPA